MQTQNRILQAIVVLLALVLITGIAEAQKKKSKKTISAVTLLPDPVPPGDPMPPPMVQEPYDGIDVDVTPTKADEPGRTEFVAVEVEPHPIDDIQSLVEYPEGAKRAGIEGVVILSALINTNGKVIKVEINKSDNPIFEESAQKAVMKAKFTPAMGNGKPVRHWYTLPISFKMSKEEK